MTEIIGLTTHGGNMTQAIHAIADASLDLISGGATNSWKDSWTYCSAGTMAGGGEGLYPKGTECYDGTNRMAYGAFFDGFHSTCGCPP